MGYHEIDSGPGSELTEFWEFDGTTKTWTQRANYPGTPVGYGVAFAVGEYVLVGGGRNVANDAWVNDFYAYHRTNHNWTQVADYPGPFGTFMKAFTNKGRYKRLMGTIPVHVVMNQHTGLLGAASTAVRLAHA